MAGLPATIGSEKINYLVLDDASDPTQATRNARRLVTENKVDALLGSTTTPTSLAARSPQPLGAYRRAIGEWLAHRARVAPDRVFLRERAGAARAATR